MAEPKPGFLAERVSTLGYAIHPVDTQAESWSRMPLSVVTGSNSSQTIVFLKLFDPLSVFQRFPGEDISGKFWIHFVSF